MTFFAILAQAGSGAPDFEFWIPVLGFAALIFVFLMLFIVRQYKRCPSNRILVIYGKVGGQQAAKCIHGGSALVIPLIQDFEFLSLDPLVIDIPLEGALSLNNIRVNVPATFTVGVGTQPVLMNNAAERLLGLSEDHIREQAQDIILGQLRLVIATLSIEEINKDREKFMALINENVGQEVNKIGLALINVNIRDITDASGYIAIGMRAAAEAVNIAKVDVAQQERDGSMGEAVAHRERNVAVAQELASTAEGEKDSERKKRVVVSGYEATAIEGENKAAASVAESNALFAEIEAETNMRADVARARAKQAILEAERDEELARLAKVELAPQEIEKQRIEVAADAEAERLRRVARGEADAILARYAAEAEGLRQVLTAKAEGYEQLVKACGDDPALAPTLLMIEQLPQLIEQQVKAISNLEIDKITVWDGGRGAGGKGATADFLSSLMGSLPAMHELASQAGIELPSVLGRLGSEKKDEEPADD
ncbi:MAG: flotillin [Pseudohongiellaceae bacterium]|jgi:flotillin